VQRERDITHLIDTDWLNEKEAAQHLKLSVQTLRLWRMQSSPEARQFKGPRFFHIGRRLWYRRTDIENFVNRCYNGEVA